MRGIRETFCVAGLVGLSSSTSTSDQVDVIYLKDGSKIVGMIVELIPDENVRIRVADGSDYVYTFDKIARIGKQRSGPQNLMDHSYLAASTLSYRQG